MPTFKVIKLDAPAHLASYFIDGDATSFDYYAQSPDEATAMQVQADEWLLDQLAPRGRMVSAEGEPFTGRCPITRKHHTNLLTYTAHVEPMTVLDVLEAKRAKAGLTVQSSYSARDFADMSLSMLGGCQGCAATLGAYNAYPDMSGFWRCKACLAHGYFNLEDFEEAENPRIDEQVCFIISDPGDPTVGNYGRTSEVVTYVEDREDLQRIRQLLRQCFATIHDDHRVSVRTQAELDDEAAETEPSQTEQSPESLAYADDEGNGHE